MILTLTLNILPRLLSLSYHFAMIAILANWFEINIFEAAAIWSVIEIAMQDALDYEQKKKVK